MTCGWSASGNGSEGYLDFQRRIIEVFEENHDAVVQVFAAMEKEGEDEKSMLFVGSGFLISKEGHILTNASIAYNADRVWIERDGMAHAAEIIGQDIITNLSILQLAKPTEDMKHIKLGESSQLPEVGTLMITIARQMGLPPSPLPGVVTGHNIAFGKRPLPAVYLRVNVPSTRGESGSPVFDLNGQLIGIMIATLPEINSSFVLPTKAIRRIRNDIIFSGEVKYAWFGIHASLSVHPDHGRRVIIDSIEPDGPAAGSGIKKGDQLLTIGDYEINTDKDLRDASFYTAPNQLVTIKIKRNGEAIEYGIEVGTRPPPIPSESNKPEAIDDTSEDNLENDRADATKIQGEANTNNQSEGDEE